MKPKPVQGTTGALEAWQSELYRLQKRLEEWSNQLALREKTLEEQEAVFLDAIENADEETISRYADYFAEDGDCGCDDKSAAGGCDCSKCENTRMEWVKATPYSDPDPAGDKKNNAPPVIQSGGDEIAWLEKLWNLKDKRRKKKKKKK